jgi:acylphosphatase
LRWVKKIGERLQTLPQAEEPRLDGVKHVNEILKLLGVEDADRITREVSNADAALGKTLEKNRYTFEDLTQLSAKDFRHLFSSMPDEKLWARALKAIDQGQRKAMLSKLPVKRAGIIAEAMADIKTTRLDSIDKARREILGPCTAIGGAARNSFRRERVTLRRRRYVISGRVQGVGYRQFTCDTARLLKIAGWVRNLPSGEVEAEAQAEEAILLNFEARLKNGPALAKVQQIAVQDLKVIEADAKTFEIRR